LISTSYAEDAQDFVSQQANQKESIVRFNDEIRKTSRRIRDLENGISITSGTTGILTVDRGGTGLDNSLTAANSIPYFSATGVISNLGIGTTGYYLAAGSPPTWSVLPIDVKVLAISNSTVTITSGSSTTTNTTTISSTGDWLNKKIIFIGEMCEDSSSCTGSTTNATKTLYSGSTSTLTGPFIYTQTNGSGHASHRSFITYGSTYPSVNDNWGNGNSGTASCSISGSTGNLVLTASRGADGSGTNTVVNCEVSGYIVREP
jgi:hypothetical protein